MSQFFTLSQNLLTFDFNHGVRNNFQFLEYDELFMKNFIKALLYGFHMG